MCMRDRAFTKIDGAMYREHPMEKATRKEPTTYLTARFDRYPDERLQPRLLLPLVPLPVTLYRLTRVLGTLCSLVPNCLLFPLGLLQTLSLDRLTRLQIGTLYRTFITAQGRTWAPGGALWI